MSTKKLIPLAAIEKLLKLVGAQRVSDKAKEALKEFLEEKGIAIGQRAVILSDHAGRNTVQEEDVKLAAKG